tara:strand:+ start:304 stop:555 length:252 start_codon:yes stop_codon:yes gene_type:complete
LLLAVANIISANMTTKAKISCLHTLKGILFFKTLDGTPGCIKVSLKPWKGSRAQPKTKIIRKDKAVALYKEYLPEHKQWLASF